MHCQIAHTPHCPHLAFGLPQRQLQRLLSVCRAACLFHCPQLTASVQLIWSTFCCLVLDKLSCIVCLWHVPVWQAPTTMAPRLGQFVTPPCDICMNLCIYQVKWRGRALGAHVIRNDLRTWMTSIWCMSWLANKLLIAILVMAMQSTEVHTPAHTHTHTYMLIFMAPLQNKKKRLFIVFQIIFVFDFYSLCLQLQNGEGLATFYGELFMNKIR